MSCRWIAMATLLTGFLAASSQPASAASAELTLSCDRSGSSCVEWIGFFAEPGETNRVTVGRDGDAILMRDLAGLDAASGCAQVDDVTVRCPRKRRYIHTPSTARFDLRDGDDFLDVNSLPAPTRIDGGRGDDGLVGPAAHSGTFVSSPGDDRMVGGAADDVFFAGRVRDGSDTMIGAAQAPPPPGSWYSELGDRVAYDQRSRPIRIDLRGARDDGERGERDDVVGMEIVEAGSAGDTVIGTARDEIFGGGGRDALRGRGGADQIVAQDPESDHPFEPAAPDDVLDGGSGPDTLDAEAGADRLIGGRGRDQLDGGYGRDQIRSASRAADTDWVMCGADRDRLEADRADVVMLDCEGARPRGQRGALPLAASLFTWLRLQVGCVRGRDCEGRVRIKVDGGTLTTGSFFISPRDTREVPLFRPSTWGWPPPGWPPPGLERARATVGGRSVPLADLPRYRITQSLLGIR